MSLPEARVTGMTSRRPTLSAAIRSCALVAVLAAGLSGCGSGGFQPLYATGPSGQATQEKFAAVDFATIPGRIGQRIRNELIFDRSAAAPQPPKHRLEVKISDSILTTLATTTGDSSGQTYQIEANFRLVDLQTQKVVFEGRSLGRTNFDRFESVYSNVRAREDAEKRAAAAIAADIRTRLAAYLSRA